ncbi:MAG: wax ester/triacylglycerol synthase domain-containing protein, partial [Myxococcaceae bacterium]
DAPSGLAWRDDPDFDIERHVRRYPTQGPVDDQALRRIVADIMVAPLDRGRPLWMLEVIPRLADGRSALVWKIHHCLADGITVMRTGPRLLWSEQASPAAEPVQRPSAARRVWTQLSAGVRLAKVVSHRGLMVREFRRVWKLSPLAGEVGSDRVVAFARCSLSELRTLGKAVGPEVTINDVLLAAVTGALRSWLQARELPTTAMKAQVPVSMHAQDGPGEANGNRDSFLLVRLPMDEPDPVGRVRAIARATGLRKNRQDAGAIYALRDVLGRAPASVQRGLQHIAQGPHEYSLNISNVPGPRGPIRVLGRHVEAMYSLAEVAPRHALRIAADSLEGSLFIGLCADPHLVPDLEGLASGIAGSVAELRARLGAAVTGRA